MQFTAHTNVSHHVSLWTLQGAKQNAFKNCQTCKGSVYQFFPPAGEKPFTTTLSKGFELYYQGIISKWHLQVIRGRRIILVTCGKGGKLQGQTSQYLKCRQMFCLHEKCHLIYDGAVHPQLQLSPDGTAENAGGNGIRNSYNTFKYFTDWLLLK